MRTQTQRTEFSSGETQEVTSQDSTHSTGDLSASESSHDSRWILNDASCSEKNTITTPCKERISWPTMTNDSAWKQFDDDLEIILETTMQGNVEKKLNTLSTIVYHAKNELAGLR